MDPTEFLLDGGLIIGVRRGRSAHRAWHVLAGLALAGPGTMIHNNVAWAAGEWRKWMNGWRTRCTTRIGELEVGAPRRPPAD